MIDGKVVASKIKTAKSKFKTLNLEDLFLDVTGQYILQCDNSLILHNSNLEKAEDNVQTTEMN